MWGDRIRYTGLYLRRHWGLVCWVSSWPLWPPYRPRCCRLLSSSPAPADAPPVSGPGLLRKKTQKEKTSLFKPFETRTHNLLHTVWLQTMGTLSPPRPPIPLWLLGNQVCTYAWNQTKHTLSCLITANPNHKASTANSLATQWSCWVEPRGSILTAVLICMLVSNNVLLKCSSECSFLLP